TTGERSDERDDTRGGGRTHSRSQREQRAEERNVDGAGQRVHGRTRWPAHVVTSGLNRWARSCGQTPRTNINATSGISGASSRPFRSANSPIAAPARGPWKTRCQNVSRKIAVARRPKQAMVATPAFSPNTPRKIRNSPTKPLRPGRPSDENIETPHSPAKIGAAVCTPPKSLRPRLPPERDSSTPTQQNSAAAESPWLNIWRIVPLSAAVAASACRPSRPVA